jgi:L,D-transpeptidase YcbB
MLGLVTLGGADARLARGADGSASNEYQRTLGALEHYRLLASEDDGEILPATRKPVEPGDHYAGVSSLIRLLSLVGDLVPESPSADSDLYSGSLVTAVRRFQARHGLEPDGRLGKGTLGQLNTPLGFRVRQLELALEQWRRIPYDPSRPAILLNLPEFRLRAFGAAISPSLKRRL